MYQSKLYLPTQKDVSKQAVAISHINALKAGLIYQTAAGIYSFLPMATKMISNIENIIREELEKIDANEIIMPTLEPVELWEESGRWQSYGSELMRMTDRRGSQFALGPTHEEVVVDLVRGNLKSYKNYPANLFQITTKFRDEARPRFGLLRGREFIMMDGYTFNTDIDSLNKSYEDYYNAYLAIFSRLGLDFKVVKADNGQMGGTNSHEFMALAEIGEDTIAYDPDQDIAYNIEIAPVYYKSVEVDVSTNKIEKISTPNAKTIESLVNEFDFEVKSIIKSVAFDIDGTIVLACVRGDREVNEIKVLKANGGSEIKFASKELLEEYNLVDGFISPMQTGIKVYVDNECYDVVDGIVGGDEQDTHLKNFNFKRDFPEVIVSDIRFIEEGDKFDENSNPVSFKKGIEIGHIFALGDRYTSAMGMKFLNKDQKQVTPLMGCYGIGVSRILSALFEQYNDDRGLILPKQIAPYDIHLIPLDYTKKEDQREFTDKLYNELVKAGYKVLVDDRNERPGSKFADADLLGLPIQITIGRGFVDGNVEFKLRSSSDKEEISVSDVISKVGNEL